MLSDAKNISPKLPLPAKNQKKTNKNTKLIILINYKNVKRIFAINDQINIKMRFK